MRRLLADPRIRLFYLGNAVSELGDTALILALAVWVKTLSGSTSLAGLDVMAVAAGSLFAPITGVLVDRVRRKPLMIWTYVATAALVMSLLFVRDRHQVWLIFVVTFLYGMSGSITAGAQSALVQTIVPPDLLADANGLEQTLVQGARLVTPALGVGLLAWLGGHAVASMDATTFVIAMACLLRIRVDEPKPEPVGERRWATDIAIGFRHLARTPVLRQITTAFAATFLVLGAVVTLGFQVVTVGLHHPASWIAIPVMAQGIGAVVGGVSASAVARRIGDRMLAVSALAGLALVSPAFAIPNDAVVLTAMTLIGLFLPWFFVAGATIYQKHTPNALMGRVAGVRSLAVQASQALGNALGAALVSLIYYRDLCYLMAAGYGIIALCLGTRRPRNIEPDPRQPETAALASA